MDDFVERDQEIACSARHCGDNQWRVMSPPTGEGTEEDYFQITELNEKDNTATLKAWSGGTPQRRMKVQRDEDLELIRDGLMMEDKEVFCTVGVLMGKEVLGDIKYVDKDPPILKMPDLVMSIIFSKLTLEDRLNSRLVCRQWGWGLNLLPIKKFVTCDRLVLYHVPRFDNDKTVLVEFSPRPNSIVKFPYSSRSIYMKDLQPLIRASLLHNVEALYLKWKSGRSEDELEAIFEQCQKIDYFDFSAEGGDDGETSPYDKDWVWSKKFVRARQEQQKSLRIRANLRELDLKEDLQIEKCTTLQSLYIELNREYSVISNFQCVPSSITSLSILRVAVPFSRSQILQIATNLPNLTYLALDVHHVHSDSELNIWSTFPPFLIWDYLPNSTIMVNNRCENDGMEGSTGYFEIFG